MNTPATSGTSRLHSTSVQIAAGDICSAIPVTLFSRNNASGMKPTAMIVKATNRPTVYETVPPALSGFLEKVGGSGASESVTSAILTGGSRGKVTARAIATSGTTTSIARNARTSLPGRRNKYSVSDALALRPNPNTIRNSDALMAIGISDAMVTTRSPWNAPAALAYWLWARTMQRNPTWDVDVSTGSGKRAAGRYRRQ